MFAAFPAVLFKHDFFGRVNFVSARDVILGFTHGADHCEHQSLIFFRHNTLIIAEIRRLLKEALGYYGVGDGLREKRPSAIGVVDMVTPVYIRELAVA